MKGLQVLTKQSIKKKTVQVASSTMLSRLLGLAREMLMVRYLGAGPVADAFITAFKIPNSLRKIFAEGALSAAMVPTFVKLNKEGQSEQANSLMTLSIILFEGVLLGLCLAIFWKADLVIRFASPGWYCSTTPQEFSFFGIPLIDKALNACTAFFFHDASPSQKVYYAISFLRILIAMIIFLSMNALIASALQARNHFFVPAFAQVLINIVFILGIILCLWQKWPVEYLCFFIIASCVIPFIAHLVAYFRLHYSFGPITPEAWHFMHQIMTKFLPCLLSMSVMEIHLFIDTSIGSFLPDGSIALIYYANRFMGIPLGVVAVAFSTILLSHFSRLGTYAPRRLSFYLLESSKLLFWIMIPLSLILGFFSYSLFLTLFHSKKFSLLHVHEASWILIGFLIDLFFFSLNKILLNIYYSLHDTKIPLYISIVVTVMNGLLSYYVLMPWGGSFGIALATTIAGIVQTILFILGLRYRFNLPFYGGRFVQFASRYVLQLLACSVFFLAAYYSIEGLIKTLPHVLSQFLLVQIGLWLWIVPLCIVFFAALYKTRRYFGVHAYFLEQ